MLSWFMPISVPVNVLPVVVVILTVLSTSAETSVKSFLCATDTSLPPINLTKGQNNYLRVNVFRGLKWCFSALALNYGAERLQKQIEYF
jgi:hypothetical protein